MESFFFCKNITHVNLENSSVMTNEYILHAQECTGTGPNKYVYKRCNGSLIEKHTFGLNVDLVCFPFSQVAQTLSLTNLILGKPLISWSLDISDIDLKLR